MDQNHIIDSENVLSLGYVAACISIFFSIMVGFCMVLTLLCCCLSKKSKRKHLNGYMEETFDLVPYDSMGTLNKSNFAKVITRSNKKTSKTFGLIKPDIADLTKKLKEAEDNVRFTEEKKKDISASETDLKIDIDVKKKEKIYVCYTFDTLSKNSSKIDPFDDLTTFINLMFRTMDPKEVIVLLKISSPGGLAFKFELAHNQLLRLKKHGFELIAQVDDICASGGYMLACACDQIICSENARIGSVGVCATLHNYYDVAQKIGITEKTITTGSHKRLCPPGEPLDEKQMELLKGSINETLEIFRTMVQGSRKLSDEQMTLILSAKVWRGKDAKDYGLVDNLMCSDDYLEQLKKENSKNQIYIVSRCQPPNKSKLGSLYGSSLQSLLTKIATNVIKSSIESYIDDHAINDHNINDQLNHIL